MILLKTFMPLLYSGVLRDGAHLHYKRSIKGERKDMKEKILGEIENLTFQMSGLEKYVYNMYFTQNRLLTFYLDSFFVEIDDMPVFSLYKNIGVKKRLYEKNSKLVNMSIDEILPSNTKNFDIYYKDAVEIIVKEVGFRFKLKNKHKLDLVGENPTFGFWKKSDKKDAYTLFKKFIPAKITEKKLFW